MNITQDNFTGSQSMLCTPPPTQDPNSIDPIVEIIIYIFSLMCANNIVCSSIFRTIFAVVIEGFSVLFATIPVSKAIERRVSANEEALTKGSMFTAWVVGNVAGYYAAKSVYNHDLPYPGHTDTAEKFEAVSDGLFGGAVVAVVYTGFAACLYSLAPITNMYNFTRRSCARLAANDNGYNRLDEESCLPRICGPRNNG
jgi:hypothetical protein